jgi:hypothetical protein
MTGQIGSLQPNPNTSNDPAGPNVARLSLLQRTIYPTTFTQETVDTNALSGISTFGGFWTSLNGAFALLFGANVLYFALGAPCLSFYRGCT